MPLIFADVVIERLFRQPCRQLLGIDERVEDRFPIANGDAPTLFIARAA